MRDVKRNRRLRLLVLLLVLLGVYYVRRPANVYDWVFVYYMSYDNDLDPYGRAIVRDLRSGVTNSKVAVTVQADLADSRGMRRIAMFRSGGTPQTTEVILKSEDSADEVQLRKYLVWVRKNWKAKNYCIVLLNHGGRLNDMCQDWKPSRDDGTGKQSGPGKWLRASEAGKILADFNRRAHGRVRLLFLQQCGRAAIQNLYTFVDSAEYIMASPLVVGAPNTYYAKTLASVAQDPNVTGETLADTIMREDEHYTLYTLISNEQLRKLPEKLVPVLNSLERASVLNPPESAAPVFEFEGEKFYDLTSYLQGLSAANDNAAHAELGNFISWCDDRLIVSKSLRGAGPAEPSYCGLSIYVPSAGDPNTCYDFLPLYQQTNLDAVMKLVPK